MTSFLTVPDELVEHAEAAVKWFKGHGYRVRPEPADVSYPSTPTFLATRNHTSMFCEVWDRIEVEKARTWAQYGKTCDRDTRVCVVLSDVAGIKAKAKDERVLVHLGVGLLISSTDGIHERLGSKDQAISVELPELDSLPPRTRRLLAPVFEKFDRGDWRDGFKDACQILESQARDRLKRDLTRGRVHLVTPGGKASRITSKGIEKMTAGQLGDAYSKIASPNQADGIIEQALKRLNHDRVLAVHHQNKRRAETQLRKNVGQQMFVVLNAMKAVTGEL